MRRYSQAIRRGSVGVNRATLRSMAGGSGSRQILRIMARSSGRGGSGGSGG